MILVVSVAASTSSVQAVNGKSTHVTAPSNDKLSTAKETVTAAVSSRRMSRETATGAVSSRRMSRETSASPAPASSNRLQANLPRADSSSPVNGGPAVSKRDGRKRQQNVPLHIKCCNYDCLKWRKVSFSFDF